jgi:hypothetical protein
VQGWARYAQIEEDALMEAPRIKRDTIVEAIAAIVMLALAFSAIAASDVSAAGTHLYWSILVVAFALMAFAVERMHSGNPLGDPRSALTIVLHWLGVLVAVQLVYLLVSTGRMANADTGLTCGVVLALGSFTAGVHGNWRFIVMGVALGIATTGVAFFEEYLWVLLGVALLAVLALVLGGRLSSHRRGGVGV